MIRGPYDIPVLSEPVIHTDYKSGSGGPALFYGMHESRFGDYLLAVTEGKQVVCLDFTDDERDSLEKIRIQWSRSTLLPSPERTARVADRIFRPASPDPVHLLLMGTPFQLKVWECLLQIPFGETVTYRWVAEKAGNPGGSQAVGNAMAKNPIAFLIPCHRVVRKNGRMTGYRWGIGKKRALLDWENSLAGRQRTLFQQSGT